jgi:HD-GYP domain-containing protein (c-di-GMP phosphodiesterase class II)
MIPRIKTYMLRNFEQLFVLVVLVTVAMMNYYIPYKMAFLDFYYLPILFAAFYLGRRSTLYGAILCILLVTIFVCLSPEAFISGETKSDIFFNICSWASFLLLTGIILGTVQEKLQNEYRNTSHLNEELKQKEQTLKDANQKLADYSKNLKIKVKERTESLERSKRAVEGLKRKVEETLYSTMDPAVVRLIIEGRLRNEKRRISVLFSDLKGFTTYSEDRQPEVVVGDLNRYLEDMEKILLTYHGHIDKYMGDGIMAEFGAPLNYETHALMAVLGALNMQSKFRMEDYPWNMRIGVATGEAITGIIGSKRQTYTAIGDVVNLASRVEEKCRPGFVTIDERTHKEVKRYFVTQKKLCVEENHRLGDETRKKIEELHRALETDSSNWEATISLGFLYREIKALPMAFDCFRKALQMAPDDNKTKVAFAETSLELEKQGDISIRGKRKPLHLYEVKGLRDPLQDRTKIPQTFFDQYSEAVKKAVKFPTGIVLPVEALDGSVGHSKVVGFLSYVIADAMGVPDSEKKDILSAGFLLDIGKEIVPHHLLNRRGNLTKDEFEEITKHSEESVRILRKMGYQTQQVFEIIEAHHENFDGTGYPKGLRASEIPLGARILAVVDMYDALTSWRPYREQWDCRAAFSEIQKKRASGKFDPAVVDRLGEIVESL